jgi:alpha-ketoglutarate-dependent 2,4-dichlorophenoxyacetate dioxygenase
MAISIYPITPNFAAEIGDVALSQPLHPTEVEAIKHAFWKYAVLIFPRQSLSREFY